MSDFQVGDKVKVSETIKSRFKGRKGTIVSINIQTFPTKKTYTEYGLSFKENIEPYRLIKTETDAWFLPSEIAISPKN